MGRAQPRAPHAQLREQVAQVGRGMSEKRIRRTCVLRRKKRQRTADAVEIGGGEESRHEEISERGAL